MTPKPKLSEIRADLEAFVGWVVSHPAFRDTIQEAAFVDNAREDIPHLLDLVERIGKVLEELLQDDYTKHMRREDVIEARALLEELGK